MKNNRNTLLMVAGIMQIVKSVVSVLLLVIVSTSLDVIDSALRVAIFRSPLYAYNPQAGEKFMMMIVIFIFLYLGFSVILNSVSGIIYIDQSKLGTEQLTMRRWIAILSSVNLLLFTAPLASILGIVALVADKNQPDAFDKDENEEYSIRLKQKIEELKKLKEDKSISKQEFLDTLTKILVEDE